MEFATGSIALLSTKNWKSIFSDNDVIQANYWVTPVVKTKFINGIFELSFSFETTKYQLTIYPNTPTSYNFSGVIICDNKDAGKVYLTLFQSLHSVLLKGDWTEFGRNYDCIIELKKQ